MTKLGWTILALIVLAAIGFGSLLSFGASPPHAAAPVAAVPPQRVAGAALAIPVAGVTASALVDTWGQPRAAGQRRHEAIDIPAPGGTAVLAAAAGRVERLFESAAGGTTLYVRTVDGDWMHYYAHLSGYAPALHEGEAVRAGQLLGFVGDTGNAGAGNTHLHFAVARMRPGERWWQGEPIDPYPLLAGKMASR